MTGSRIAVARSADFYRALAPFEEFGDFAAFEAYTPVPDDWVVMISDVEGSTEAIAAGRYKQVNMVGAASITAVLNVCGEVAVPYVFGGDGGTVVVPGALAEAAGEALIRLQAVSERLFGLRLRAGAVTIAELKARGADLRVRKYQLSPGNHLSMFAGEGLELCDEILKSARSGSPFLLEPRADAPPPDLDGLSCRWEPLVPKGGRMLTLMLRATSRDPAAEGALLGEALGAIAEILGHSLKGAAPANRQSMVFKWPPKGLALEARATAGSRGLRFFGRYLAVLLSSLIQAWCERNDRRAGPYDAPVYRAELRANTDFRKYDGILRLVLDVSPEEAERITAYLEKGYAEGRLVYGAHLAEAALMTCLVFSLEESRHVHFIDGASGGFARAAQGFKARLVKSPTGGQLYD